MQSAELAIVGLGCGSLDQVTLGGLKALKEADVIIQGADLEPEILQLLPRHVQSVVIDGTGQGARAEATDVIRIAEMVRRGLRVVRLNCENKVNLQRLNIELFKLRDLGVRYRVIPSMSTLTQEAWDLQLPWLSEILPIPFQILQSIAVKGDREFWRKLSRAPDTLVLDLGLGRLTNFVDKLLLAGANPDRPLALVAHHPGRAPVCWLTTLEEVDELLPQWKPQGATIVYIGTWPHTVRDTDQEFWGTMHAAAESWLKEQRA